MSKKNILKTGNTGYNSLLGKIGEIIVDARRKIVQAIDTSRVFAYWHIGMVIVEYEQKGKDRAEYGEALLKKLSVDMTTKFGRGFSRSNLQNMRLFYLTYPKCQTLSGKSLESPKSKTMPHKPMIQQTLSGESFELEKSEYR